ncbi:MAG: P-II family nitrogen regulator [Cyanobacteriota/Melainabacteria group bacterium]|nr:P-II family nitrogen regulator [Cyanobacteria bacterium HKST-UBA01]MCB9469752.1 P-II family nitrogen regulator [Candidatus Obscuribacterales bacterium]
MKLVSAVIKPKSLPRLQSMLRKADVPGLTVVKAQGFGTEHRSADINNVGLLTERIKIEVALEDDKVDEVIKVICDAVGTNSPHGDGVIFVWDLVSATRIGSE